MDKMSWYYLAKGMASVGVCLAGAFSMYVSKGTTGIGWAVLGLFFIWAATM